MRVWLYCILRDEIRILPYFLRHYVPWVEKLIFYDDHSTDGTRDLIASTEKCELRDWPGERGIVDDQFVKFANTQWMEARGHCEYVAFVDADELLFHPQMLQLLSQYLRDGVEVPLVKGYTMISDTFPTTTGQIYDEIRTGIHDICWSKNAIFRVHMFWNVGRHSIDQTRFQPRTSPTAEIKLLHYRCLGMDYLRWRHQRNWERVPERCRALNYGRNCEPGHEGHHGVEWFQNIDRKSLEIVI